MDKETPKTVLAEELVAARKRIAELERSEAHYRTLVETLDVSLCRWLPDTTLTFANEKYKVIFGVKDDPHGKKWLDFLPDETREGTAAYYREVAANPHKVTYEHPVTVEDGRLSHFQWIDIPLFDKEGKLLEFQSVGVDITERKNAEETSKMAEQRYRTLFEEAPVMNLVTQKNTDKAIITDCNQVFLSTLGYKRTQVIGRELIDFYSPASREQFVRGYAQALNGIPLSEERELIASDGRIVFTLLKASSIMDSDGNAIGTQASYIDITERKLAEQALKASNDRFTQMAEKSLEVFWMFDNQLGRIIYLNPAYEAIWGYSVAETLQDNSYYIEAIHPEDRSVIFGGLERQSKGEKTDMEYRIIRPDGSVRWIHDRSFPIFDQQGALIRTTGIAADVTERKLAEIAIRASEMKLRSLVDSQTHFVIRTDMNGKFTYWNNKYLQEFGWLHDNKEIKDATPMEAICEYHHPRTFDVVQKCLAYPGQVFTVELDKPARDGGVRTTMWEFVGLADENNQPIEVQCMGIEITALKKAQTELVELNRSLEERVQQRTAEVQDLYDNAPIGYHSIDAHGMIVRANKTHLDWLGYTREEFVGHSIVEFLAAEGSAEFQQAFPEFLQSGWIRDVDVDMIRKDGSLIPVLISATGVYDEDGNFVMTRSAVFDNTGRKAIEQAMRQSEETYRALFENSNDGIFMLSPEREELRANQRALDMVGYTPEEYEELGRRSNNPLTADEDERADADQRFAAVLRGERVPLYERVFRTKDGHKINVEVNLSPVRDSSGKIIMVQSVVRDITERKKAEDELRRNRDELSLANQSLEKAARLKDEFLASMSHELRTPLAGILGLSETLQLNIYGELNEKQKKTIRSIEDSGRHLLDLINDILDLSKIEAAQLELNIEPVSLADICQASLQLTKGMANKKRQRVHYTMATESIALNVDGRRMKQILVNLLGNAIKFTPDGGELGLEINLLKDEGKVQFVVWDKGIGIKPEDMGKLFKPFVQIDSSLARQYAGTGLGLSLVQRLVELHNGTVEMESIFGEGSRFIVTLPWMPSMDSERPASTSNFVPGTSSAVMQVANRAARPTVLVADDNETLLEMVSEFLDAKQYNVEKVTSGLALLEKVDGVQPDIFLVDIQMPGMDGLETIQRIRKHPVPAIATIPIIAITALSMTGDRERCLEAGANDYISKPLKLADLAAKIETLLRENRNAS